MREQDDHRGGEYREYITNMSNSGERRTEEPPPTFGLSDEEAAGLGADRAARVRTIRLLLVMAQHLRNMLDRLYADDGITAQQAALLSIIRERGAPTQGEAAELLGTSHQNVRQLVAVLERKGLLRVAADADDGRVRRLRGTAKNTRYWARRDPKDFERVLTLFDDLDEGEVAQLFSLLLKVFGRLRGAR